MLGAIIGDMVGSIYEFHPCKTKDFNIYDIRMRMTDDSILTLAVMKVLMKHYPINYSNETLEEIKKDLCIEFINTWNKHKNIGFGGMFYNWCKESYESKTILKPYNSYGNGSAMRISPVGWVAGSVQEVKLLSRTVTEVTHNHPEGIKGAEAIALSIYLSLHGFTKEEIKNKMINEYYKEIEDLDFDDLVKNYKFNSSCQGSVPIAIYCFLISNSIEDTIRNCVAVGGDVDTIGAMAVSIAEAYYSKDKLSKFEDEFLYRMIDPDIENFLKEFYSMIGNNKFNNRE